MMMMMMMMVIAMMMMVMMMMMMVMLMVMMMMMVMMMVRMVMTMTIVRVMCLEMTRMSYTTIQLVAASNLSKKVRKSKKGKEICRSLEREEATLHGTAHDMMYCTVLCCNVMCAIIWR